jgi:hypothetical protein
MIKSIKLYLIILCGFLVIVAPIILLNYFQDPYAIFKKIVDEDTYISDEYRYSFPNIAKKMEFDTAIIGTSDSLPYHQPDVKKIIPGPSFNFAIEGATNYEQSLLVKNILENKPNTLIVWQINWLSFLWIRDHSRIGNNFPLYLYKKSNLESNLKSLLSPFNALKSLPILNNFHSVNKIANIASWEDSSEEQDFKQSFEDRKISFFDFINSNNNIREFDKNELDYQFDSYIESIVNEFKDAKFIIVLPPFHSRFMNEIKNENPLLFEQFSHFNYRVTALENNNNNVKLVNFHEKCNFKNRDEVYKDFFHFKNRYAKYFIKEIMNSNNSNITPIDCP